MDNKAKAIAIVPIDELKPNPENNNVHTESQLKVLEMVIKKQGFRTPIVVSNRSGMIVCGHARYEVAKRMNARSLPVIYQDFKDEEEEYLHLTADNEIAKQSSVDIEQVQIKVKQLGINDVKLLGIKNFKMPVEVKFGETDEDKIPEIHNVITKTGDVWALGNHRVMCGNSTIDDDVEILMNGERANIAFTSPPYNAGDEVEIGSKGHKYESHNDNMDGSGYLDLLRRFTDLSLKYADMSIVNIQQLAGNKVELLEYLYEFREKFVDVAIWNNGHGTPSLPRRVMNCAFEYIYFFSNENKPPRTIKTANDFHGNIQNVYNGPKQTKNEFSKIHRATFPVHLPEFVVSNFSSGSVLDLFNGTGTTLIACEKLGRKCFAMDMDPLYIDTTIKRWEKFTGKKAELINGNV